MGGEGIGAWRLAVLVATVGAAGVAATGPGRPRLIAASG